MRVMNTWEHKSVQNINYKKTNQVNFTGLKNPLTKCMFVFDLDGSFAHGAGAELEKITEFVKQRTAQLVYATGRNKNEVEKLQQKLAAKGITLPTPEYLISSNGQFIYKNVGGVLVKDTDYEAQLRLNTNFDSSKVFEAMHKLANSDKYRYSGDQLTTLGLLHNFTSIKERDPEFFASNISHYEWNPSEFMSEYFVSRGVDVESLKSDIQMELAKSGIKTKFIENRYSKPIMDACPESILLQSHPLRRHSDGSMTALFLCPADKADGVKYLRRQQGIPYREMILAGNDDNDVAMAELAMNGAHFICLNNASAKLKQISNSLRTFLDNVFMAKADGAAGIFEGLTGIIKG